MSNPPAPDPATDPSAPSSPGEPTAASGRVVAGWTFLAGLLLVAGSLFGARAYVRGLERITTQQFFETLTAFLGRTRQMADSFELMTPPGKTAFYIGSSTIMFDLSPVLHDATLKEEGIDVSTFNLGTMSMTPELFKLISLRVREQYERANKRAEFSVIEFSGPGSTIKFRDKPSVTLKRARLLTSAEIASMAREDATRAAQHAVVKMLNGLTTSTISAFTERLLFGPPAPSWWTGKTVFRIDEEERVGIRLNAKLRAHYGGPFPSWDVPLRGEFRRLFPDTAAEYHDWLKVATSEKAMQGSVRFFKYGADAFEMHFAPEGIEEFIDGVENFKAISEHTFLLIAPRNRKWHVPTPEGLDRLRAALREIQTRTQVPLISYWDTEEFNETDFCDLIHLNETTGKPRFSPSVAKQVAHLLKGGAPPPFPRLEQH